MTDQKKHPGFLQSFALGGGAAFVAEIFTFPMDVTKTRMQIRGESASGSSTKKKTPYQTARSIVMREGFFKLWQGMSASLCRHFTYSGTRMAIYSKIRETLQKHTKDQHFPVWMAAASGACAGGCSQFLASPFDLIKVQMQMDGLRALKGKEKRIQNVFQGVRKVYGEGGLRALYKGSLPNAQRGAVVNMADIGGYDTIKRVLRNNFHVENQVAIQCIGGFGAGLLATTLACPIDVVKNRMMNQPVDKSGRGKFYAGCVDCLQKTIANEGPFALYKGFQPMWLRIGPFTVIFWNVLEFERQLLGLSTF